MRFQCQRARGGFDSDRRLRRRERVLAGGGPGSRPANAVACALLIRPFLECGGIGEREALEKVTG